MNMPRSDLDAKEFLTVAEAAEYCGHRISKFRQVVSRGLIRPCYLPGSTKQIFNRDELRRIILSSRKPSEALRPVI
jgi:hypothetical protein